MDQASDTGGVVHTAQTSRIRGLQIFSAHVIADRDPSSPQLGGCTVALRRDEEPRQEYGDLGKPKLDQSGRQQDHTARSLQGKWHRSWRRGSCEDVDRSQQQCHFATHAEWRDAHARNLRGGRFCCRDDWQRRCCDRWRRRWLELGRRRWHRLGRRRCFCWWRWFWLC